MDNTSTWRLNMKRNHNNPLSDKAYASLCSDLSLFPFSFTYGGKRYAGFDPAAFSKVSTDIEYSESKDTRRILLELGEKLEITLILTHYYTHGATEWTVLFENKSTSNAAVIEEPQTELRFCGSYPRKSKAA